MQTLPNPDQAPRAAVDPNLKVVRLAASLFGSSGLVFTLGSCCWWSFSGQLQSPIEPGFRGGALELLRTATAGQLWSMAGVCVLLAAGMANVAFGIGLQRPRRKVAATCKWTACAVACYWLGHSVAALLVIGGMGSVILAFMMLAVWAVHFLVAGAALAEIDDQGATIRQDQGWTRADEDDLRSALSPRSPDKTNP